MAARCYTGGRTTVRRARLRQEAAGIEGTRKTLVNSLPQSSSISDMGGSAASVAAAPGAAQIERKVNPPAARAGADQPPRHDEHGGAASSRSGQGSSGATVRFRPAAESDTRPGRRYCLITPCRDEEQFAEVTLRSIAEQAEPPTLWIVVDDGSKDGTPEILRRWQERLPYLRVITRPDRGERKLGGGVIDAFYDGYHAIDPSDFDYICKLDLDLQLPATYFADVMDAMEADGRLAVFSGKPYFRRGTRLTSEMCGDENAVGMVKFYRVEAFEQIGGFVREVMWDGIDGHRCRMLGWRAESRDDPKLRFVHLRPMGTSHKSWWTGRARHGRGQYFMGTAPLYMLASAIYRMSRPPRVIGGIAMLWGYVRSGLSGSRRYEDEQFRRFLRRYQWMCLLMGKKRATRKIEAEHARDFRGATTARD